MSIYEIIELFAHACAQQGFDVAAIEFHRGDKIVSALRPFTSLDDGGNETDVEICGIKIRERE